MNQHRGSYFNEFLAQENLMTPTPRTDAIAHRGLDSVAYIAEMTDLARELEAELTAERALAGKLLAITEKAVSDHEGTLLCVERCKCSGRRIVNDNAEALASWREARNATV